MFYGFQDEFNTNLGEQKSLTITMLQSGLVWLPYESSLSPHCVGLLFIFRFEVLIRQISNGADKNAVPVIILCKDSHFFSFQSIFL